MEIFQARLLEWVAVSFSSGSSQSKDQTRVSCVSCIGRRILYLPSHRRSSWNGRELSVPSGDFQWTAPIQNYTKEPLHRVGPVPKTSEVPSLAGGLWITRVLSSHLKHQYCLYMRLGVKEKCLPVFHPLPCSWILPSPPLFVLCTVLSHSVVSDSLWPHGL